MEQAQKEQSGLKQETFIYVGKEFLNSGESESGAWKRYSLNLKKDLGDKFAKKMYCFDRLGTNKGLKLTELEEGKVYTIFFKERPYVNQFGNQVSKTVVLVYEGKNEDLNKTDVSSISPCKLDLPEFSTVKAFITRYLEAMTQQNKEPNLSHFIGAYMRSNEKYIDFSNHLINCYKQVTDKDKIIESVK